MKEHSLGAAFDRGFNNFHVIRLIAALAVIYGHAYNLTGTPGGDFFLTLVGFKFIGGVAVDVFFAVSGFLVAASISRSTIKRYLISRCLRIFPALIVAVVICTFALGPLVTKDASYFTNPQTWSYFINNALMTHTEYRLPGVFEGLRDPAVNGSLWSLPVEFRLYLILMGVSLAGLLRKGRFAPFAMACMLVGLYASTRWPWFITYSNWVDASAFFLAGVYLWIYRYEVRLSHWGAILVIGAAVALHGSSGFYVAYFAATCLSFVLCRLFCKNYLDKEKRHFIWRLFIRLARAAVRNINMAWTRRIVQYARVWCPNYRHRELVLAICRTSHAAVQTKRSGAYATDRRYTSDRVAELCHDGLHQSWPAHRPILAGGFPRAPAWALVTLRRDGGLRYLGGASLVQPESEAGHW